MIVSLVTTSGARLFLGLALLFSLSTVSYAELEIRPAMKEDPIRYIYLTFDDGPLKGSENVFDAIAREQININVFVVGSRLKSSPKMKEYFELYRNNPYIEIGNHSYSHAHDSYRLFYAMPGLTYQDFMYNANILGLKNRLARLPGRNMWRLKGKSIDDVKSGAKAADLLFKNGYSVFGWDVEWRHDSKTGAPVQTVDDMLFLIDKMFANNKTVTPNHLVILCHDEMFRTSWEESRLKQLIEKLKARKNIRFEHLSNYPQQKDRQDRVDEETTDPDSFY
jgi:peptidoglycan-N-acetylglucosamine deacetylase